MTEDQYDPLRDDLRYWSSRPVAVDPQATVLALQNRATKQRRQRRALRTTGMCAACLLFGWMFWTVSSVNDSKRTEQAIKSDSQHTTESELLASLTKESEDLLNEFQTMALRLESLELTSQAQIGSLQIAKTIAENRKHQWIQNEAREWIASTFPTQKTP